MAPVGHRVQGRSTLEGGSSMIAFAAMYRRAIDAAAIAGDDSAPVNPTGASSRQQRMRPLMPSHAWVCTLHPVPAPRTMFTFSRST